jgi:hypothetical protein
VTSLEVLDAGVQVVINKQGVKLLRATAHGSAHAKVVGDW